MKPRREKINKRKIKATKPKSAFSQALREAREVIARGETEQGLSGLNKLAASTQNPVKRAKILLLIGESETHHSRHTEALAAFKKASLYASQAQDLDLVLLSGTGQVRSLLRSLRTDEAKTAAKALLADLETAEKALKATLALTLGQLATQGEITVPARPPRLTVGLTKVANAFIESGLTDEARLFLLKAIQLSPNGASRARQSLAKLALAADQPERAERYAREALLMGRFQAKTVAAWQLYLDARARQNLVPILEADVFASFLQHASGRRATASVLSMVRVLRAHGDPTWKTIAADSINNPEADPIISTEIEKLLHADSKLFGTEDPRKIAARAFKLLRAVEASKQEFVARAKEYVRYSLLAGREPNVDGITRTAEKRFSQKVTFAIRHSMALGAMASGRHDIARILLGSLITETSEANCQEAWGKAAWALARMEGLLDNNAEAAFWYTEVAAKQETPPRFKIQAMLRGLDYLGKSGDNSSDIAKLTGNICTILNASGDFRVLLDAARQLVLAGPNFSFLATETADRATELAEQAIATATAPSQALGVIEYLSRKLYWDLGRPQVILVHWDRLTTVEKSEFQVSGGSTWYNYLSVIFLCLTETNRSKEAKTLASTILDDEQATSEGYAIIGSCYAQWLIRVDRTKEAYEYFAWLTKEAPTHRSVATAHYWLALRNHIDGNLAASTDSAQLARLCYGGKPSLLVEWAIDAKSLLILSGLDVALALENGGGLYDLAFLHHQRASLLKEKQSLLQ